MYFYTEAKLCLTHVVRPRFANPPTQPAVETSHGHIGTYISSKERSKVESVLFTKKFSAVDNFRSRDGEASPLLLQGEVDQDVNVTSPSDPRARDKLRESQMLDFLRIFVFVFLAGILLGVRAEGT